MKKQITLLFALLFSFAANLLAQKEARQQLNFDFDWTFSLTDSERYITQPFVKGECVEVQLPHDWNIRQEFDKKWGGAVAYLPEGIGWYQKSFRLPASSRGKQVRIVFDGIFMQSDVYINGHHLGHRPYGFCSIVYDLTPYLKPQGEENFMAVRVNTTGGRPRWYAGAGIYRHAWLEVTNGVHVETYGTYVTTPKVSTAEAEVSVVTTLKNSTTKEQTISLLQQVRDSKGQCIAKCKSEKLNLAAGGKTDVKQDINIFQPQLWSPNSPVLYVLETIVKVGGRTVDVYNTTFGVRTAKFDPNRGFLLNGEQVKLQGMCLHHDAGAMGVAVPFRSYERRLEILKEYGVNALRMSHNQPSTEFLDLCDRMGFLVIDEAFDKWKSGNSYYTRFFDEWWQSDLGNMLLRDRNHPSVILWSIGNELIEAWSKSDEGVKRAAMLQDFVHKMEPTRQVMLAAQNNHQDKFSGVTDVIGYNYLEARAITDHKKHPERCFLISEELPYYSGAEGNLRSYTPINPWSVIAAHDFIAGGFIWPGVDYLGEAGWPSKGWPNGLFDVCMFEKPRAAYHRAMWNPEPMVRIAVKDPSLDIDHGRDLWQWPNIAAHWNFPERYRGLVMEVLTTTNCEEVELYMNGKLMGRERTDNYTNNTIVWNLPYNPGKLEAKGFNQGKEVANYEILSADKLANLKVEADRREIKADGQDLVHLSLTLVDDKGVQVQTDNRHIKVHVSGEGRLVALDSGELRAENTFFKDNVQSYFGRALVTVQATRKPGTIRIEIEVEGLEKSFIQEILVR